MAKKLLHLFQIRAALQSERCSRVAQIVRADIRQVVTLHKSCLPARRHSWVLRRIRVHRAAENVCAREQLTVVFLLLLVFECHEHGIYTRRERNGAALFAFCLADVDLIRTVLVDRHIARHIQRKGIAVNVSPLQTVRLAATETAGNQDVHKAAPEQRLTFKRCKKSLRILRREKINLLCLFAWLVLDGEIPARVVFQIPEAERVVDDVPECLVVAGDRGRTVGLAAARQRFGVQILDVALDRFGIDRAQLLTLAEVRHNVIRHIAVERNTARRMRAVQNMIRPPVCTDKLRERDLAFVLR